MALITRCVRCGRHPARQGTWICTSCYEDPRTYNELAKAEALGDDVKSRRTVAVVRFGWAGGWPHA